MLFFVPNQRMFGWGTYGLHERHTRPGRLFCATQDFGYVASRLNHLGARARLREMRFINVTGSARTDAPSFASGWRICLRVNEQPSDRPVDRNPAAKDFELDGYGLAIRAKQHGIASLLQGTLRQRHTGGHRPARARNAGRLL
jgi:hypothetical protein